MFYFDTIKNKKILKSGLLSEFEGNIKHLFTTKESLIKTKDPEFERTTKTNRELILEEFNIEKRNLIEIKQTHSTNVIIDTEQGFRADKNPESIDIIDNTDGVILCKAGMATILNFADCTPVILYDPENHAIAGLHAGWRGTAGEISKKGLEIMVEKFNTKPSKTLAIVGPCIGQEDFECGGEVYNALVKTLPDKDFEDTELFKFKNNKVFPDLAKVNAAQLKALGVKNIEICQFKTGKDNDFLFSYRKENGTTSRISLVLKLENRSL